MKRFLLGLLVFTFAAASSMPVARAQEEGAEPAKQLELATLLANLMGLSRNLPAVPTPQQIFGLLLANGVSPAEGWDAEAVVTKADLARVVVQAMDMAGDIENPDDPNAWVAFLEAMGISIDTIGDAVVEVTPSPESVAGNISRAGTTWDPLDNVSKFGQPDEREFGTDAAVQPPTPEAPQVTPPPPPPPPVPRPPSRVVPRREIPRVIGRVPLPTPPQPQTPVTPTVPANLNLNADS